MTGRNRRASTSSVESIDQTQIHWRQETSIVRSVATQTPSDDWPVFELRDAVVLNGDGHTLENALHVAIRGPYTIRGHLIIDDPSQKSHLITRVRKSTPLEIRHSHLFAIGESDDRSPLIWVSGRGGWYEISPSAAYGPIYRKMCEATTFYYHMVDIYDASKTLKKTKKTKESALLQELSGIFHQYAARVGDGSTFEEVVARCSEHAAFLINQFLQVDLYMDWKPTALYKWIVMQHPDLLQKIDHLMKNPQSIPPPISIEELSPAPASSSFSKSASVEDAAPRGSSLKRSSRATSSVAPQPTRLVVRGSSRPIAKQSPPRTIKESQKPKELPLPPPPPAAPPPIQASFKPAVPSADDPAFASVAEALETTMDVLSKTRKGATPLGLLNRFYFDYSLPLYRDATPGSHKRPAQELLHYYAKPLLQRLDKANPENQAVYAWLEELAGTEFQPVAFKPSDFPVTLYPRKRKPRPSNKDAPPHPSPAPPPPAKATDLLGDEVDDDEGQSISDAIAARRSKGLKRHGRRKKSYLRPVAGNRKRPRSQMESDAESDGSGGAARNSHYFSDDHQGENDDDNNNNDEDDDGDDVMEDAPASNGSDGKDTSQQAIVVIRAERIPGTSARGPDETWRCDQDGCDYMVRASDDSEGQAKIRAHYLDHAQQLERVSLAVTESRGHMPINHLLDKIKRMGEKSLPNGQDNSLPTPIKRKLIV
ncbi:hypothetical protein CP532_5633 [Ophiocordyceps camponoti-leonardi (nom. inval.)]|nr:hypothetical protein CP532_5633 [Ophiocordyceps camponoti-leonardi (nom. inval.)]